VSKRKKFIFTSVALTLGFLLVQLVEDQYRLLGISGLTVLSVVLFSWSLKDGLGRNATLYSLILPPMFTIGVGLFWFLLPSSMFTRVPVLIFYWLGVYSLCLTSIECHPCIGIKNFARIFLWSHLISSWFPCPVA